MRIQTDPEQSTLECVLTGLGTACSPSPQMFVYGTMLSLLATWSQQGRNPYEGLQRVAQDNEMIS
jgi:hypothetical protein